MNNLYKLILLMLAVTLTSCLQKQDGLYIVYKTETVPTFGEEPNIDYRASEKLASVIKGRRFELKFNDKYILMKEPGSKSDMTLTMSNEDDDKSYEHSYIKNKERVQLKLYDKSATGGEDVIMFMSVYEQIPIVHGRTRDGRYGLIKCYLAKK